MTDFFDTTEEQLATSDDLIFGENEIVKLKCIDHFVNKTNGNLTLKCQALSGPHNGKPCKLRLNSNDNDASKKTKLQFMRAFWTPEEINSKKCNPARLIGKEFSAKSKLAKGKKDDGKVFQNWYEFTDLSKGGTPQASPATAQAPAQQAVTADNISF